MIKSMIRSRITNNTWYRSMLAGNEAFIPVYPAYDLISTTVLGSDTSSVTFNNSGAWDSYKHLQIRATMRGSDSSVSYPGIRFNGVSSETYSWHALVGNGSSVGVEGQSIKTLIRLHRITANEATAGNFTPAIIDILDVNSTSKNKTVKVMHGYASPQSFDNYVVETGGAYLDTYPVSSISVGIFYGSNFKTGSRFSLYGIKG